MAEADQAVLEFLKSHRLGVLATGRRDGSPQQSLVAYHFDGDDIVISTRAPSAKAKNLGRQSRASLCVSDGPRVVVVYGSGSIVDDADAVIRYNLTRLASPRLASPRRTEPPDEAALAQRLQAEERVVVVLPPEKYLPPRFESRR